MTSANPGAPAVLGLGAKDDRDYSVLGPLESDRAQYMAAVAELVAALEQSDD